MRKYIFNYNFFETIDTEEKAYWLGFVLADGNISNHLRDLNITLKAIDRNHLEKFVKNIEGNQTVKIYHPISSYTKKPTETARLVLCSVKLVQDLANLNIVPKKTMTVKVPIIQDTLNKHFWRGVLDGDGSINFSANTIKSKTGKIYTTPICNVQISGNLYIMESFIEYLKSLDITTNIQKDHSIYRVGLMGVKGMKLLHELYDNSNIYLDRKLDKYKKAIILEKSKMDRIKKQSSVYKYIYFDNKASKWTAKNNANKFIGRFATEQEALEAYKFFTGCDPILK